MELDHTSRLLFSRPELVADLLRDFVREPRVEVLDRATLDRVSARFVSADLREREGDVIWWVRSAGDWLSVYLLIEFRSRVDRYGTARLLVYVGLPYQDLPVRGRVLGNAPTSLTLYETPWRTARCRLLAPTETRVVEA